MRKFTQAEDAYIRENYLKIPLKRISKNLGRHESSARGRLVRLGLEVPKEIAQKFKQQTCFKKGSIPKNKGKKLIEYVSAESIERMRATQFKKGKNPHNTKYDGYERISKDGYIEVRVSSGKFVLKHRKVWEEHHGEIPKDRIIIFIDNNRQNCSIENLEMISREENAIRNHQLPNYPRELQKAEYLRTKIKKLTNGKK